MAVEQIRIKGKKFMLPKHDVTTERSSQKVQVLGWTVSIQKNGTVICYKAQKAYDGWHTKRMIITPKGQVKITMKVGEKETKTVKKSFLVAKNVKDYELDVTVVLADGWVDDSKACYARDGKLQDFLDQNGLDAVHRCNPNNTSFTLKNLIRQDNQYSFEDIQTDGKIVLMATNDKTTDFYSQIVTTVMVKDATWVIKGEEQNRKHGVPTVTKVLFTSVTNVTKLNLS